MSALESCSNDYSSAYAHVFEITLEEHFDYRSIQQFRKLSTDKMQESVQVLVDMRATRYIDSSGIALLHCLRHWIRSPEVSVELLNCSAELRQILPLSKLHASISLR